MSEKGTSELARDTLRMLAARKLLPNPENYSAIYHELSGHPPRPAAAAVPPAAATAAAGVGSAGAAAAGGAASAAGPTPRLLTELFEQIARLVEFSLPALGEDDPKIGPEALALAVACREPVQPGSLPALRSRLANFNHRLSFVAEEQGALRGALLGMLQLVFSNIAELSLDDRWLHGQVELLKSASAPPLSLRRLDEVQRRLKDVIFKQGELKRSVLAAQEDTKRLLATFIERLSELAELNGTQGARIEQCARRIEAAQDLASVRPALSEVISATRLLADEAVQAREDLGALRRQAAASEAETERLRHELESVSKASRHDVLTGLLNRSGLDEALQREIARAHRLRSPLALALLDIDDFKRINDQHGHPAGDAALSHLAAVARAALPPQFTLSRIGGEEFVFLMPDVTLEEGTAAMMQLQRELTRHFFLADGSRVLITFSAGVTLLATGEEPRQAISRADQAMYQAKRRGKNRVLAV